MIEDLRFALRLLVKSPGFTLTAILTLALGIGANAAIFSVIDALLLRPLHVPEPERLVGLRAQHKDGHGGAGLSDYLDWRANNSVFEDIAVPTSTAYILDTERVFAGQATAAFFGVLEVRPLLGRLFRPGDDETGRHQVLVLTYGCWQRRFGARPDIVGQRVRLDAAPYEIIGVLPADFRWLARREFEFWTPLAHRPAEVRRGIHMFSPFVARLKRGVTVEQAQAELTAIARRIEQQYPETNRGWGVVVRPFPALIAERFGDALLVLGATVGFVLLIACANLAGLLLARGSGRAREMAVRAALGASRTRMLRQMLTENLVVALAGGVLGLVFASWAMAAIRLAARREIALQLALDARVLAFAFGLSLLTGVLFGLLPSVQGSRVDLNASLKAGGGRSARSRTWLLNALVVSQMALAIVLLSGAGLAIKAFARLAGLDTGLQPENVLTFDLDLPRAFYRDGRAGQLASDFLVRMKALPGVRSAAAASNLPMSGSYQGTRFAIEGRSDPADWTNQGTAFRTVTPDYFRALGISVLRGRAFNEEDRAGAGDVAIVSAGLARRFWPGEDPLGQRMRLGDRPWRTIVGIAADVAHNGPAGPPVVEMYMPAAQFRDIQSSFALRTTGDPAALVPAVRAAARRLDRDAAVIRVRTMEQALSESLAGPRQMALTLAVFAVFALALSAIGLYGVVAYAVSQRAREIGVRIALGADRARVLSMVLRRALALALAGAVLGLAGALAASRLLGSLLYGVSPRDAAAFTAAPLALGLVALAASYLPARRAARVDPIVTLRCE